MSNVFQQAKKMLENYDPDSEPNAQCIACNRLVKISKLKLLTVLATSKKVAQGYCPDCHRSRGGK